VSRLELSGGATVLFTDRSHGNMSSVAGPDRENGAATRERLRESLGLRALARGYQVHGTAVRRVVDEAALDDERRDHADGQATALRGVGAIVLAADCLPVALVGDGAVTIVHSGWRGLAAGVLEEGLAAITELGGSGPVRAVLGPCAGACCYEVGPEVKAALGEADVARGLIDLRAIAARRLRAAGVVSIEEAGGCTICEERYFSFRREGEAAGRQAGVAWLS
jgi:purine-nucleoside/S-methyl-5'-thioadenosine phosphorylase / adenosine deaminase